MSALPPFHVTELFTNYLSPLVTAWCTHKKKHFNAKHVHISQIKLAWVYWLAGRAERFCQLTCVLVSVCVVCRKGDAWLFWPRGGGGVAKI